MRRGSLRTAILFLLAGAIVIAGSWYAYSSLLLSVPLEGETSHDFGEVMLGEGETRVEHTFHLVNTSGHAVTIEAVKPECGCVIAPVERQTIAPGGAFTLPVTMIVPGRAKTVPIVLHLGADGMQRLKVTARGIHASKLFGPGEVSLPRAAGGSATFMIQAAIFNSYDRPAEPAIESPPGIEARFEGWTQKGRPADARVSPVRWQGVVSVAARAEAQSLADNMELVITLSQTRTGPTEVRVPLRLEPESASEDSPGKPHADE